MNWDLFTVAVMAGAANWVFRTLPVLARSDRLATGGWLERFLSGTGPAAIATLFVAAILPALSPESVGVLPVVIGTLAVLGIYVFTRSVVFATLAGAVAHGLAVWVLA